MSPLTIVEARGKLQSILREVLRASCAYTEHAKRKTMIVADVLRGFKHVGRTIYAVE
jgi:histone H4